MTDQQIIIFSGAGLSAESGIQTYHDKAGIWQKYDLDKVCNQLTWQQHYAQMHEFYNENRQQIAHAEPNIAHHIIASLKDKYGDNCHVITQNVDDLLEKVGCYDVLHVHGELTQMHCEACGHIWEIGYEPWYVGESACRCGSTDKVRPNVVFFNGKAPNYDEMFDIFEATLLSPNNVVIVIGTDGKVIPIYPMLDGAICKKLLCNLHPSKYILESIFDEVYPEPATTALPKIADWLARNVT